MNTWKTVVVVEMLGLLYAGHPSTAITVNSEIIVRRVRDCIQRTTSSCLVVKMVTRQLFESHESQRWLQPDLLPVLRGSLLITWAPWCFCLLNRNRCYAENLLKMLSKIKWTLFFCVDRVIFVGGAVNNRALLRTVGWFYDNMGVVQLANTRTRPSDSADRSLTNLLLPGGSFKTWIKTQDMKQLPLESFIADLMLEKR